MEGIIIFVIWAIIALVSVILKKKQEGAATWDENGEEWESTEDGGWTPGQPKQQQQPPREQPQAQQQPRQQPRQQPQSRREPQAQPQPQPRLQPRPAPVLPQAKPLSGRERDDQRDAATLARTEIEDAIRKQQAGGARGARRDAAKIAAQTERLTSQQTTGSGSMAFPPMPQSGMSMNAADVPPATSSTARKSKKYALGLNTREAWRRSIVAREVLDRPRAFDT